MGVGLILHPYFVMLHIVKNTSSTLIFTGTEQCVLTNPYFLFIFTNGVTEDVVSVVGTNISTHKTRYDEVVVDGSLFDYEGYWTYKIYEQLSSTNTNPAGLNKVEEGFMIVSGTPFEYTEHSQSNTFDV